MGSGRTILQCIKVSEKMLLSLTGTLQHANESLISDMAVRSLV